MAANTVGVQHAMAQIAHNCGDLLTEVITSYASDTSFVCGRLAETTDDTYNYGLMRKLGGSTYATISDYVGSTKTFTLAGSGIATLSAAGDIVQWFGFNMQKRGALFEAVNAAIRDARGTFYREVRDTRAGASITLAAGTNVYALPTTLGKLLQVGIQTATTEGIVWYDPHNIYRVYGQEGAYSIEFMPNYHGTQYAAWSSRVHLAAAQSYGTFADAFSAQPLLLRYLTFEPEVTGESDTTQLPLNYLGWVGANYYSQWLLANGSDDDRRVLNVHLPQIQANAARAMSQLSLTKPKLYHTAQTDW